MLRELIMNSKRIVIMGYGKVGRILIRTIDEMNPSIEIIVCDNNVEKKRTDEGKPIWRVEDAVKANPDLPYIVAKLRNPECMEEQLLELGIAPQNVYGKSVSQEIHKLWKQQGKRNSMKPWDKIPFEVHLAEHCNLNCAGCAHFSSLAEEEYCSLTEFRDDMQRLSELLGGESGEIHLLGGEPLLNSEIVEFMKIARNNFKNAKIGIVTNGTLLDRVEQKFWDTCRENRISLMVTQYPINVDYEGFLRRAEKENVEFIFFRNTGVHCDMHKYPFDLNGEQDVKENFCECEMANKCILLKKGKLYTCSVVGNVEHFNKYFQQHLEVCQEDYIDIYSVDSKEELTKRLASPIPFCRYCDVNRRIFNQEWKVSHKTINEWLVEDKE